MSIEKTGRFDLDKLDQQLYNHTQKIVLETMQMLLDKPEFQNSCTCDQCLKDIAAYALNRLPAKYIIAKPGCNLVTKITEFETQINIDAVDVVKKAIRTVSKNPRH